MNPECLLIRLVGLDRILLQPIKLRIKEKLILDWQDTMLGNMGMSESLELEKKLTKIWEELRKREVDIRDRLADIEKKKVEALRKVEELKRNALHDIQKVEKEIMKAKLDPETKTTLASEIFELKQNTEKEYQELRTIVLGKATSP